MAALTAAFLIGFASQADADYAYRNLITTQASQVNGTAGHDNFPVLAGVTDPNLKHTGSGRHVTDADAAGEWILYKRTGNADVYQNINHPDEFQARIHTVPINYWDGETFKPIDLTTKELNNADYKYEMSAAPYQVYFSESLYTPIKLMSQEKSYEFTLKEMSYNAGEDFLGIPQPTSAVLGDEKVIYPEAFENIDIEYIAGSS